MVTVESRVQDETQQRFNIWQVLPEGSGSEVFCIELASPSAT